MTSLATAVGTEITSALIGSVSALFGALIGAWVTIRSARNQWRYQHRTSVEQARLTAYADEVAHAHLLWGALMKWRQFMSKGSDEAGAAGRIANDARVAFLIRRSTTELLASQDTLSASDQLAEYLRSVHDQLYDAHRSGRGTSIPGQIDFEAGFRQALAAFVAAAQADFDAQRVDALGQ